MRDDFAIFIMVHGRPDKMWTLPTLRKHGYTGKVYLVADDLDETRHEYKKKYGDDLIIFDKKKAAALYDSGDNSGDLRSTMYSANTIPRLAKERGIKYFMIMCDDYYEFYHMLDKNGEFNNPYVYAMRMDSIIDSMIEFYDSTNILTLAMVQRGDFIGGAANGNAKPKLIRKAMNTFLCSVDRPIKFMGRLNEDVTTYAHLGNRGELFLSFTDVAVNQKDTQSIKSGLTEAYIDSGTYVKSFFSVMYNPSCVKVSMIGTLHQRIHHAVQWKNAVPKIIEEKYKKQSSDK